MVMRVDADAPGAAMSSTTSGSVAVCTWRRCRERPQTKWPNGLVRGYDDEAIITLIDGRRQNFEAAHDGRYFIDPALLKSVEIVRGASSAVYGGGGVGGVVAFETKDANDMLAPGENTGALTSLGYRSANGEFAPLVSAYGRTGGLDVIGSLSYRRSGDIRLGDVSTQDNSSTLLTKDRVYSGFLKPATPLQISIRSRCNMIIIVTMARSRTTAADQSRHLIRPSTRKCATTKSALNMRTTIPRTVG